MQYVHRGAHPRPRTAGRWTGRLVAALCWVSAAGLAACDSNEPEELIVGSLEIVDVEVGSGLIAAVGDSIFVRYVGTLEDGTIFDAVTAEDDPAGFVLNDFLIDGWVQGVPGMAVGGRRQLTVPPNLGYGLAGVRNATGYRIPPNAFLFFDIILENVVKIP